MNDPLASPTLYADILRHALARPDGTAVIDDGREISYGQFAQDIEAVSRRLARLGLPAGRLVGIAVEQPYLHWVVLIALWRHGSFSMSMNSPALLAALPLLDPAVVITDRDLGPAVQPRQVMMDQAWLVLDGAAFDERPVAADQPLRLLLSSGTTGIVKMIALTRQLVDRRLDRARRNPRFNQSVCFMSMVNVASVEFFFSAVAWSAGGMVEFSRHALLEALDGDALRANLIFMNTAQLSALVNQLPATSAPRDGLTVIAGGGVVPLEVSRKALQRLTKSLVVMYGSTEAGSVAINPNPLEYASPGVCGFVVPDMEVQVLDAAGNPVGAGMAGELRLRSTSCVGAYLGDPAASALAFRDGWFYPGDIGMLAANGLMTIVGRIDEMLNIGGAKIAPSEIEHRLLACPGVRDVVAFAVPDADGMDRIHVAIVRGDGYDQEAVIAEWNGTGIAPLMRLTIVHIDTIARNAMGKVMRAELTAAVQAHRRRQGVAAVAVDG